MSPPASLPRRLAVLWTLYFVQGLPYGFQATALPVYLREEGLSLTAIGFATALSLPWMLKALWAPWVDRYGSARFGRRRSWILPMQVGLALTCGVAALAVQDRGLQVLLAMVFLMNLFAATMDIAVDGLAVDLLTARELGHGNISQVVGYKAGMLTGGGLLVWASGRIGWQGLFLAMAGLIVVALLVTLTFREPRAPSEPALEASHDPSRSLGAVIRLLSDQLRRPGALWLLLFVATYKLGESMADLQFMPFLYDAGFAREQIGLFVGTWGMGFSIAGSFAGGFLATRLPILQAVGVTAALRALPVAGEWWLSVTVPTTEAVIAVTCAENLFGGALTTAMFAYMMSRVDRRIGATHYTLLAAVEVWGKVPIRWVSGLLADATSYATVFALATLLSVAFLGLLIPLARSTAPRSAV